jgi:cation transport ATPase
MGNLDFTNNFGFSAYAVALLVAGVVLFVLAGLSAARRAKTSAVVTCAVVGAAAFGYGFYLIFMFQGGTYFVSYYVFVLPILLVVRVLQAQKSGARTRGQRSQAKRFKQQVKAGDAVYQQQAAAAAPATVQAEATPSDTAAQA